MDLPALTHHEIVRLVEPFARRGRLVDLAASDRAARRIAFRAQDLPSGGDGHAPPACHETLALECRANGYFILLRTLAPANGPAATVRATGADPADLLARVLAVPVAQLFSAGPGWCVARSYDVELPRGVRAPRTPRGVNGHVNGHADRVADRLENRLANNLENRRPDSSADSPAIAASAAGTADTPQAGALASLPPLVLSRAELQAGGLALTLVIKLPGLRSVPADLTLRPLLPTPTPTSSPTFPTATPGTTGSLPALPEDLLAVLGWDWARLVPDKQGWTSKLRLRGGVLRRSRTAEAALHQAGAHLARVMAAPPGHFHDEHRLARWGVVLRRGLPSITSVLMVAGALLLPRVLDPANTGMWLALHYVPIALLAVAFSLQELPQFEIPPWPRRSAAPGWTANAAPALAADQPPA